MVVVVSVTSISVSVAVVTITVIQVYRSGTVNSNTVNSKFHQFEVNLTGV